MGADEQGYQNPDLYPAVEPSAPPAEAAPAPPAEAAPAPASQSDNIDGILARSHGVVMKQETQVLESVMQVIGVPYEAKNRYVISALPEVRHAKKTPDDPQGWAPTQDEIDALEKAFMVREESNACTRLLLAICGCLQLRPLKLHFAINEERGDAYFVTREFNCGGCCCCEHEMVAFKNDSNAPEGHVMVGRVREDFSPYLSKCLAQCCKATMYTSIQPTVQDRPGVFQEKYRLRTNICCCGPTNNCCGGTCCKNDAVYDILDPRGVVVGKLQKTYAPGSNACGRCCFLFSNYVLEFPIDSTADDRILLLSAMFQIDYLFYEKKGND